MKLGPLDFGGVVANVFSLLFRNVGHYLILAFALAYPMHFTGAFLNFLLQDSAGTINATATALSGAVNVLVLVLAGAILDACLTHSIAKQYIEEYTSIGETLHRVGSRLGAILASTIIVWVVSASGFSLILIPLVLAPEGGHSAVILVFLIGAAWFIPFLILFLTFIVYIPALMLEDLGPIRALKRAAFLMRGLKLRTFGVLFVIQLLTQALSIPFVVLFVMFQGQGAQYVNLFLAPLVASAWSLLRAAVIVVTYFDGRVRREGFGIQNLVELFE